MGGAIALLDGRRWDIVFTGGTFFESPRWHDGWWYASDLYAGTVVRARDGAEPKVEVAARLDDFVCGLGWGVSGELLAVAMTSRRIFAIDQAGRPRVHADLSDLSATRLNDMVTDSTGRGWVGNYGFDLMGGAPPELGALFHITSDGKASVGATGLVFPNGSVIAESGRTLVVGETFAGRYTEFDILDDGSLGQPRLWAAFGRAPELTTIARMRDELQVIPDGCALARDGSLWVADVKGRRAIRVAKGGPVLEEVRTEWGTVFACALGGPDGRSLLLCLAPGSAQADREHATDAIVVSTRVDVA